MKITTLYSYLGTNGVVTTPIFLPNVPHVIKKEIVADNGYILTKDNINFTSLTVIPEQELQEWQEVKL